MGCVASNEQRATRGEEILANSVPLRDCIRGPDGVALPRQAPGVGGQEPPLVLSERCVVATALGVNGDLIVGDALVVGIGGSLVVRGDLHLNGTTLEIGGALAVGGSVWGPGSVIVAKEGECAIRSDLGQASLRCAGRLDVGGSAALEALLLTGGAAQIGGPVRVRGSAALTGGRLGVGALHIMDAGLSVEGIATLAVAGPLVVVGAVLVAVPRRGGAALTVGGDARIGDLDVGAGVLVSFGRGLRVDGAVTAGPGARVEVAEALGAGSITLSGGQEPSLRLDWCLVKARDPPVAPTPSARLARLASGASLKAHTVACAGAVVVGGGGSGESGPAGDSEHDDWGAAGGTLDAAFLAARSLVVGGGGMGGRSGPTSIFLAPARMGGDKDMIRRSTELYADAGFWSPDILEGLCRRCVEGQGYPQLSLGVPPYGLALSNLVTGSAGGAGAIVTVSGVLVVSAGGVVCGGGAGGATRRCGIKYVVRPGHDYPRWDSPSCKTLRHTTVLSSSEPGGYRYERVPEELDARNSGGAGGVLRAGGLEGDFVVMPGGVPDGKSDGRRPPGAGGAGGTLVCRGPLYGSVRAPPAPSAPYAAPSAPAPFARPGWEVGACTCGPPRRSVPPARGAPSRIVLMPGKSPACVTDAPLIVPAAVPPPNPAAAGPPGRVYAGCAGVEK